MADFARIFTKTKAGRISAKPLAPFGAVLLASLVMSACGETGTMSNDEEEGSTGTLLDIGGLQYHHNGTGGYYGGTFDGVTRTDPAAMPTTGSSVYTGNIVGHVHDVDAEIDAAGLEAHRGGHGRRGHGGRGGGHGKRHGDVAQSDDLTGTASISVDFGTGAGSFSGSVDAAGYGGYDIITFDQELAVSGNHLNSTRNDEGEIADTKIHSHFFGEDASILAGRMKKSLDGGDWFAGGFSSQ